MAKEITTHLGHLLQEKYKTYGVVRCTRRARRVAFFFSMRRSSLLETNQRLRRTSAKTLLLVTSLLKRRSSCSGDSLERKMTFGSFFTPFLDKDSRRERHQKRKRDSAIE